MASEYYKGVLLDQVPTGFGIYTGVVIKNDSNTTVSYIIEAEKTTLYKNIDDQELEPVIGQQELMPDIDALDLNLSNNTIKVSSDLETVSNKVALDLEAGYSGIFYITHKPFSEFNPTYESVGLEQANVKIFSESEDGINDEIITIDVTGQRILNPPNPDKLIQFYCRKSYNEQNGYYLNANWSIGEGQNFITGFILDVYTNSSDVDSSHVDGSPFKILLNKNETNESSPDYLSYYNNNQKIYSFDVTSVNFSDSNIYARIRAVNGVNEEGENVFAKGVDFRETVIYTEELINATIQEPGDNLNATAQTLYVNKAVLLEKNLDLTELIYKANNNSYDLSLYGEVHIKLSKASDAQTAQIYSESSSIASIFLSNANFKLSNTFTPGKFKINIEIDNIQVFGYNGEGSRFTSEDRLEAENGSDIFDLPKIENNGIEFEYQILLGYGSSYILSGYGGGASYKINHTNDAGETTSTSVNGAKKSNEGRMSGFHSNTSVSRSTIPESAFDKSQEGLDGKFLKESESNFPDVYLKFSEVSEYKKPNLNFRFSARSLSNLSVGSSSSEWSLYSGNKQGFIFKSVEEPDSNFNPNIISDSNLKVCEAYGKKFYELYNSSGLSSQLNSRIQIFDNNENNSQNPYKFPVFYSQYAGQVEARPNYTILVFALGKKNISDGKTYLEESNKLVNRMGNLHKFIDNTQWDFDSINGLASSNPYAWAPNFYGYIDDNGNRKTKATFVGSPLNSISYLKNNVWWRNTEGEMVLAHGGRQQFKFSNKELNNVEIDNDGNVIYNNSLSFQELWRNEISYDQFNAINEGYHVSYTPKNSAYAPSFDSVDDKFYVNDGSEQQLSIFNLYFVLMRSTVGQNEAGGYSDYDGSALPYMLTNETWVNGIKTFEHQAILGIDGSLVPRHTLISLTNSSGQNSSDERPRLYLMEYLEGQESSVTERDKVSDNIMKSLIKEYEPLILKSSNMHVARSSSGNEQLSFDLPASSNFLKIQTR